MALAVHLLRVGCLDKMNKTESGSVDFGASNVFYRVISSLNTIGDLINCER